MSIKLPSYFRITSDSVFKFVFKRKQYAKHLIEKILGRTILLNLLRLKKLSQIIILMLKEYALIFMLRTRKAPLRCWDAISANRTWATSFAFSLLCVHDGCWCNKQGWWIPWYEEDSSDLSLQFCYFWWEASSIQLYSMC